MISGMITRNNSARNHTLDLPCNLNGKQYINMIFEQSTANSSHKGVGESVSAEEAGRAGPSLMSFESGFVSTCSPRIQNHSLMSF